MHTIENASWRDISFGERWAMTCIHVILCMVKPDERVSVLMTMFGANLLQVVEQEKEVDAVIETLRLQLHADMQQRETIQ